jgi:hypothetical protein
MKIIFYLSVNGNWWDKIVAWWTCGKYSHCELLFSDGICFSSSPRDGGTRFKKIDIISEHWNEIEISSSHEIGIREWCEKHVGEKYDWLGVFMPKWGFRKRRCFCVEACLAPLIHTNTADPDMPVEISPIDFYKEFSQSENSFITCLIS